MGDFLAGFGQRASPGGAGPSQKTPERAPKPSNGAGRALMPARPQSGVIEMEMVPDLDWVVQHYFPGVTRVISRVRSARLATVLRGTLRMVSINFGMGGIVYEWGASVTGAGINAARNTPSNQMFETAFEVSRYHSPFQGDVRKDVAPVQNPETIRADALFGESSEKDEYFRPMVFIPANHALHVYVRNVTTPEAGLTFTLANVVLFTIEPAAPYKEPASEWVAT